MEVGVMTVISAYIDLFIRGECPEENVPGEMSGYYSTHD